MKTCFLCPQKKYENNEIENIAVGKEFWGEVNYTSYSADSDNEEAETAAEKINSDVLLEQLLQKSKT